MGKMTRKRGEYQHVTIRGVGRQLIFEETMDNYYFLKLLRKFRDETSISILAYCLMGNHVHLLIHDPLDEISVFMRGICSNYAYYFNKKYDHSGHVFQGRFKNEIITDIPYLVCAFLYILNNPANASLAPADHYQWSSFHEYGISGKTTDTTIFNDIIGDKDNLRRLLISDKAAATPASAYTNDDDWPVDFIRATFDVKSGTELASWPKPQRDAALVKLKQANLSIRTIERLTGISRNIIQRAK